MVRFSMQFVIVFALALLAPIVASDDDVAFTTNRGDEFGLVECDVHAVVTYWPRR
jgi:hypothetical protein